MNMDKKAILPTVAIAGLACVALMLTVIGGLYAYNTFASGAQSAYAQSSGTDTGPKWTVTPVTVGGNQQFIVVIVEDDNMYMPGTESRHMSVYEIRQQGNAKGEVYLVATRTLEWDSKIGFHNKEQSDGKGFEPDSLMKTFEKDSRKKKK
jgi:hypothetical protein